MQQLGFIETILDTIFNGILGGLSTFIINAISAVLNGILPFAI